jgi:DNA-binding transcriptional MerR regulator
MAYTVKQVAAMSGVSVRTLHFYDEAGLLKPAFYGANGYRFYEEPQLLVLQQILFYRELGFELKRIREIVGAADFEIVAALRSHREVLVQNLARTRSLIETVDRTVEHLKGGKKMENREMFTGFVVAAENDRFGEQVELRGEPHHCKVSSKDTNGAMCVFEVRARSSGPLRLHYDQDQWIYVVEGEFEVHVGDEQVRLGAGESVFVPRNVARAWVSVAGEPRKLVEVFQPAGKMEEFYREIAAFNDAAPIHEAIGIDGLRQLFDAHGVKLVGPPLPWRE